MLDNKLRAIVSLLAIISFLSGTVLTYLWLPPVTTVSYIAQSELLELEKARLKKQGFQERQLFLGQPQQAIKLIEQAQSTRQSKNKIVLLSEKPIYGKGVESISKEVHSEIIKQLEDLNDKQSQTKKKE